MKINVDTLGYKSILFLVLGVGITACTPPEERERERLQKFNQRNSPEYQIVNRVLYVDWKSDPKTNTPALKLKVPMNYLQGGINDDGFVGQILYTGGGPFGYSRPKDPNEIPKLGGFDFEITDGGRPVALDKDGHSSSKEDVYGFSINSYPRTTRPLVYKLTNDRGGKAENIFRAKDINGLQNYKELSCYDIEELKEDVRSKRIGYEGARQGLERLANKAPDDPTPKNCLSNERNQFWISPPEVPDSESVGIYCGSLPLCEITFHYKSRRIVIYTRQNRYDVIPKWQTYRNQVIQTIQQFETQ